MLDPRLVESVVVLSEELHFGRAAARLHLATPALSQQIARAERQLGVQLFLRNPRGVELTPGGRAFVEHAREVVERLHRAELAALAASRSVQDGLRVGVPGDIQLWADPLLRRFRARCPTAELTTLVMYQADLISLLRSGELDVLFDWGSAATAAELPELPHRLIATVESGLAMQPEHPLAARDRVPLPLGEGERLVMFERQPGPGIHDLLLAQLAAEGCVIDYLPVVGTTAQEQMLASLAGGAMTPNTRPLFDRAGLSDLCFRPTEPPLDIAVHLVWETASPALEELLACLDAPADPPPAPVRSPEVAGLA